MTVIVIEKNNKLSLYVTIIVLITSVGDKIIFIKCYITSR